MMYSVKGSMECDKKNGKESEWPENSRNVNYTIEE